MALEYPTSIRLPTEIRRFLRKAAKLRRRTMTRLIIVILEEWMVKNPLPEKAAAAAPEGEEE